MRLKFLACVLGDEPAKLSHERASDAIDPNGHGVECFSQLERRRNEQLPTPTG